MIRNYTYKGKQEGFENAPSIELYNCNHCGTTISKNNIERHLELQHKEQHYQTKQQIKEEYAKGLINHLYSHVVKENE